MNELLDKIDNSLQEVEEQLLQEFQRIRNSFSDQPFEPVDPGIRNSLSPVVDEVRHMLEHSGDKTNLQLMTERHESLFARMAVLKQLFDVKIPTAYLHEVHSDVTSNRQTLEQKAAARRAQEHENEGKSGLFGSIKGMFGGEDADQEAATKRIRITAAEEKALTPVQVYLDNGIYSASRELAMLATRVHESIEQGTLAADLKKPPPPRGKAHFASRDLSASALAALDKPKRARTPEEIRRKLEASERGGTGASKFESRDLSSSSTPAAPTRPMNSRSFTESAAPNNQPNEPSKATIAQSPEEIRRKLAARQAAAGAGKASFTARDIEPVPDKTRPAEQKKSDDPAPKQGKAVFESRDLSKPGPNKR